MQRHPELTLKRVLKFLSEARLGGKLYPDRAPVSLSVYSAPDRISYAEAMRGDYRPARVGDKFGPLWSTHWFRVEIDIPTHWAGREVFLLWDSSSEACVWQAGLPMQGLTGSGNGWASAAIRKEYRLARQARGGEHIELYVEIACNGLFGVAGDATVNPSTTLGTSLIGLLQQAEIATFDREAWDLYWDLVVIADMAQYLPSNTPRAGQALRAANDMVNAIQLDDRRTWPHACAIAAEFFAARAGEGQHNLSAVGLAHIDSAWLWPRAEAQRKCIRTFSSAVLYMEDYADYKFACSQAAQFEWIKQTQPGLYEKIKARVREGCFIPVGGSWVEPDCNIPSGESLVRQFLVGQRFFHQEFGLTCREFWNPDVFGYSAALPQVLAQVGIRYFLTQKLSWNQFNKLPSHTFLWEGLDGTRVLTHFPPADTYTSMANVKEVLANVSNFKDHDRAQESCLLFGFGDGGSGPTMAMLEQLRRMSDVDGLPRVQIRSPQEFFARCEADIRDPLVWVGELYFELHRGTYTTQARNKLLNRRSELTLRDVEFLSALALALRGTPYPADDLLRLWKTVLFNQFHDIIPGSSIREVYVDSDADYADVLSRGAALRDAAAQSLAGPSAGRNVCAINTLSTPRMEVVKLPDGVAGQQNAANGKPLGVVCVPPMGYAIAAPGSVESQVTCAETAAALTLENDFVRATFRRDGRLISLLDLRADRECVAPGQAANNLVLFDDSPNNWDAWDVDVFHLEKRADVGTAKSARVIESGPLRVSIEFDYDLSPTSTLRQTVSLTAVSPRLDFANEVEWHESDRFLKVEFPLNVRSQHAAYEMQFGHVQRPTHFNTSWDLARFEVCGHKWADLSEPDFGVALLNDCKYGYATHGNIMRLSLLRAPKSPDPEADQGHHTFRYALLPHPGSFQQAGVIDEGYCFNAPLLIRATDQSPTEVSFFRASLPSVVIDTIKKAEDSNDIVVRMYEAHGTRGTVRLSSSLPIKSAWRCNLLEEEEALGATQPLEWSNGGVSFDVTPFKIVTLKLAL